LAPSFDDAAELGNAAVDDGVIDDGLAVIRRLWDAGLAHRDIKPSNLLVRDGHLLLIDVAFSAVRASSWRQAVDLANMMLCLALRSSPGRVYLRALRQFAVERRSLRRSPRRGASRCRPSCAGRSEPAGATCASSSCACCRTGPSR